MNRTQLNKQLRSLKAELNNAQNRAPVIERRIGVIETQIERLKLDSRPRARLVMANSQRHVATLRTQLEDTYATLTYAALEIAHLEPQRANLPPEPVKSIRRSTERSLSGLYRMGRLPWGRTI